MAAHSHRYHHRHFPIFWGGLAEIIVIGDVSVVTMSLCCGCGHRTFQTASHLHGIHPPVGNLLAVEFKCPHSFTIAHHHRHFPIFGRVCRNPRGVNAMTMPLCYGCWPVEPFKLHSTSIAYICKVFEHLKQLWMGIWQHIPHTVTTTDISPYIGEGGLKSLFLVM